MSTISLLPLVKLFFNDNNPGLTKIKNTQYDSVYVCECKSMLRKERHYMFVIGAVDVIPIGSNVQIEDINNISCIQFRTFQEPILQQVLANYIEFDPRCGDVAIKRYNISGGGEGGGKKISEYMFEYMQKPYNVHIIHSTDSDFEYVPDGNLLSALITWDTLVMASINVGAPPPQPSVEEDYGYTENSNRSGIPPLRNFPKSSGNWSNDLEFERRSRSQIRPSARSEPSSSINIPPRFAREQQDLDNTVRRPPPPPAGGGDIDYRQHIPRPHEPSLREPRPMRPDNRRGTEPRRVRVDEEPRTIPPPPKRFDPNFNPRPVSRKN